MGDETRVEPTTETRRADRWAAEPAQPRLNGWAVLAVALVLAGYGVAALVAAALEGSVDVGDRQGLALVAVAPSLGALGVALGLAARRRGTLRWLAWIAVVLGSLLVVVSIAAVTAVLLALRSFS